jgi:thiol-disulfide isomerase/thioredoxin
VIMKIVHKRACFLWMLFVTLCIVLASRVGYSANMHIKAPEVISKNWLNTQPVRMADLRGKVVLVEFWTFGCSNCRHVEPHVKEWFAQFHNSGLEIISIHSPELGYEKVIDNVRDYVSSQGITYPVAIDNDFSNWGRYNNHYWPTLYLIDKRGFIRHRKIGEGDYAGTEQRIRSLLQEL